MSIIKTDANECLSEINFFCNQTNNDIKNKLGRQADKRPDKQHLLCIVALFGIRQFW